MNTKPRVRFAPSPTGPLHIGGVRTALYNYLFAKKHQGDFILRIEDTDQKRFVEGSEDYLIESLDWLGITPNEGFRVGGEYGSYKQSERKEIYKKHLEILLSSQAVYYAFDTSDALDQKRKEYEQRKEVFSYNYETRESLDNSLSRSEEETLEKINNGEPYVIRFKNPVNKVIKINDLIRGEISVNTNNLDDKILFKSDGLPTYHLANVVDDYLMKISHVIRGEEWLPSTPLHCQLYEAFGWEKPQFAHLPLLLKPEGKGKLSKRDGDKGNFPVFPLKWNPSEEIDFMGYREEGYLPEAVVNMLALLGWNPGTEQEFFSKEELIQAFDLDKVSKSGARFSIDKAKSFNQHYLQNKDSAELAIILEEIALENGVEKSLTFHTKIVEAIKERAVFAKDLWTIAKPIYIAPIEYDTKTVKKIWKENTPNLMSQLTEQLESIDLFERENIQTTIKSWIEENEFGFGKIMQPARLALCGEISGPDLFQITAILGKEESVQRIKSAIVNLD